MGSDINQISKSASWLPIKTLLPIGRQPPRPDHIFSRKRGTRFPQSQSCVRNHKKQGAFFEQTEGGAWQGSRFPRQQDPGCQGSWFYATCWPSPLQCARCFPLARQSAQSRRGFAQKGGGEIVNEAHFLNFRLPLQCSLGPTRRSSASANVDFKAVLAKFPNC